MKKQINYLILLAKILLVAGIFYFLIKNFLNNAGKLHSLNLKFSYGYAFLSFAAALIAWALTSWNMGRVFAGLNCKIPYKDVFSIYFKSMLGKYLPGKFWQIAGSTYLASQKGVPEGISITAFVGGQIYSLIAGMFFLGIVLIFNIVEFSGEILKYLRWTSIPIVLAMIIMVVKPSLFEPPMNLLMRLFKRKEVKISIPIRKSFEIFLLFLLSWMVFGLSFWLFANAILPCGVESYFKMTAVVVAATIIGFFALFAPGGLGVREGMTVIFLASTFPAPIPTAMAIGYRVMLSISELIPFFMTFAIDRKTKKKPI